MGSFNDRTGEIMTATNGQKMTLIRYVNSQDITVKFEDGTVVENKSYDSFSKGKIANPNFNIFDKVGEKGVAYNGLEMEIIAYRRYDDIDIRFETGEVVTTTYSAFRTRYVKSKQARGYSKKFKRCREKYLNTVKETKWGTCTLVEYFGSDRVVVRFDDNTEVVTDLATFKRGSIKNPNIDIDDRLLQMKQEREGVESVNRYGYKAKIKTYNSSHNFVIEFEDKTTSVCHSYQAFLDGKFKKPAYRLGEKNIMNNGLEAEVIEYESDANMTVRFENGVIRKNIIWSNFVRGTVSDTCDADRLGEETVLNNGLKAKIIAYRTSLDIDIKMEDGTVLTGKQYSSFKRGGIGHPAISVRGIGSLGGFTLLKRAYTYGGNVFYICYCNKCLMRDILTPSEILNHVCKK